MSNAPYPYAPEWDELAAIADAIRTRLVGLRYSSSHPALASDRVFVCWADPEDIATFPAIAVMPSGGDYGPPGSSNLSPGAEESSRYPARGDGNVLIQDTEFQADIDVVIWATDPIMRSVLTRAVRERFQDQLTGVNGKEHYGADLPCPRYFGGYSNCHVSAMKVRNEDSETETKRRHRKAFITLRCTLPVYHAEGAQDLLPRLVLESVGDEPI